MTLLAEVMGTIALACFTKMFNNVTYGRTLKNAQ